MLDRVFESENRAEVRRNYRLQTQIERERDIEENFIRNEQEKIMKQQARDQELRLANELERLNIERLRDEKMRQQLRETR